MSTEIIKSAADLAPEINAEWERAERAGAEAVEAAIRCGELLDQAKRALSHGEWLPWLEENFRGGSQRASEFRRLWQRYGDANSRDPGNLPNTLEAGLKAIATGRTVRQKQISLPKPDPNNPITQLVDRADAHKAAPTSEPVEEEEIEDAEVVEIPDVLTVTEERKYTAIMTQLSDARNLAREAAGEGLTAEVVANALRDAMLACRRAATNLQELLTSVEKRA